MIFVNYLTFFTTAFKLHYQKPKTLRNKHFKQINILLLDNKFFLAISWFVSRYLYTADKIDLILLRANSKCLLSANYLGVVVVVCVYVYT